MPNDCHLQVAKALEEAHDEKEAQKDVDNDLDLWEEEQIKKGANIPASHKDQIHGPVLPQADFEQAIAMEAKMQPVVLYSAAYIQYGPGNVIHLLETRSTHVCIGRHFKQEGGFIYGKTYG